LSYSPGPHATQASCAAVCRNPRSQKHAAISTPPGSERESAGHAAHAAAAEVAPATTPYVFCPHNTHALSVPSPAVSEYFPTGQSRHVTTLVAPAVALHVPGAQSTQSELPLMFLKLPGTHRSHGPPSMPEAPALHEQFTRDPDASGEFEFTGHRWQSGLPLSDHVPETHRRHDSNAPAAEYNPAPHLEHS